MKDQNRKYDKIWKSNSFKYEPNWRENFEFKAKLRKIAQIEWLMTKMKGRPKLRMKIREY